MDWLRQNLTKVIIGFFIFSLLVAGYAFYRWKNNSGLTVDLTVPPVILVGVPFDVGVKISNSSLSVLQDARLDLNLPTGVVFLGSDIGKTTDSHPLGNLGVGTLSEQTFKLLVIADENSVKTINATLSYSPGSFGGSRFEMRSSGQLIVGRSGLEVGLDIPNKVFNGQEFNITLNYKNLSTVDFQNLDLNIEYPAGFTFKKASVSPDVGNNQWNLGDLRQNSSNSIIITGTVIGPESSFLNFKANLSGNFLGKSYPISSQTASFSISPSPLSLKVDLNQNPNYISKTNDSLNYTLTYTNNTGTSFRDVVITAQLVGAMYDFTSLTTDGSLNSNTGTILWNASNDSNLALIPANSSGSVNFKIRTKQEFPITRLSDKNFTLKLSGRIESPTVPELTGADRTIGLISLENKVMGKIKVDAKAFYHDPSPGISNTGSLPPKVGQPTQYTIHWLVTNTGTDVSNIELRAFLGGGVRFLKMLKSSIGTDPSYNDRTQEVVWDIPALPAGRGIISAPEEAIFQVEAVPNVTMIGTQMLLMNQTNASALDNFTNISLSATDQSLNTGLSDDSTITQSQGLVAK